MIESNHSVYMELNILLNIKLHTLFNFFKNNKQKIQK